MSSEFEGRLGGARFFEFFESKDEQGFWKGDWFQTSGLVPFFDSSEGGFFVELLFMEVF